MISILLNLLQMIKRVLTLLFFTTMKNECFLRVICCTILMMRGVMKDVLRDEWLNEWMTSFVVFYMNCNQHTGRPKWRWSTRMKQNTICSWFYHPVRYWYRSLINGNCVDTICTFIFIRRKFFWWQIFHRIM